METLAACPLCGNKSPSSLGEKRDYVTGRAFRVQACPQCGLGFVNPRPDPEEIKDYYPSYYSWQEDSSGGFVNRLEKFYRFQSLRFETTRLRAFSGLRTGAVLDVGCGSGDRLAALEEAGFAPHGIEMGSAAEKAIASKRWPIVSGTVFSAQFPTGTFSAVTFYNVIEHIHQPVEAMKRARTWLKPNGVLVVQLPNRRSWQARWCGLRWSSADVPRDLFYFDSRNLCTAMAQAGFELLRIDHVPHLLHPPDTVLLVHVGRAANQVAFGD